MARSKDDQLGTAISEADQLEQEEQADPRVGRHQKWPVDTAQDVNETDRLEQPQEVVGDPDEEYPPDPP